MWRWAGIACLVLSVALPAQASGTHVVAEGQTLGRIAKRYGISIELLCEANQIRRRDPIKPGQKLVIPDADGHVTDSARNQDDAQDSDHDAPDQGGKPERLPGGMHAIDLPYGAPAYYFTPQGRGRRGMRPVIVYLHGRGGHPDDDCLRWAPIARRLGWLVCPSGPIAYGDGRAWDNNWVSAHTATMAAIESLRKRFGRRVQLYGNTLIGFSEGAYAAMNVGVREPHVFNRWLILAAASQYWGGPGLDALKTAKERVRRVFLITGENDGVVDSTHQVAEWLEHAGVTTRVATPDDMGHEVALDKKPELYRRALVWLARGSAGATARATRRRVANN